MDIAFLRDKSETYASKTSDKHPICILHFLFMHSLHNKAQYYSVIVRVRLE